MSWSGFPKDRVGQLVRRVRVSGGRSEVWLVVESDKSNIHTAVDASGERIQFHENSFAWGLWERLA